ncbi:hypothetical protein WDJ51_09125 [Rathayibacter sp. YIM 133350]
MGRASPGPGESRAELLRSARESRHETARQPAARSDAGPQSAFGRIRPRENERPTAAGLRAPSSTAASTAGTAAAADDLHFLQRTAGNRAVSAAQTATQRTGESTALQREPATPLPMSIEIPQPDAGINKVGFIDTSDGANIRSGPIDAGGAALTDNPLPPATRVFVSGTYPVNASTMEPQAATWWYATAFTPGGMVRGYIEARRITVDVPNATAQLYAIQPGDTAERLAVRMFKSEVTGGHDLRYYENVLLYVNSSLGRNGVRGSYQDPGIFGGGANNVQLVAGERIWLPSAAHVIALEGTVPGGSLTNGLYGEVKRIAGHIEDIMLSVTDAPSHLGEVAGEYAQAIRDHMVEIVGIVAAFVAAEALSAFLAATPTGVGQIAAIVIQLGLAAFGAAGMVTAVVDALGHAEQWLTLAWTADGKANQIASASREFIKMLVSIAMAALAYLGVKGNYGKALTIAESLPPMGLPAFAVSGGAATGGATPVTGVAIGPPSPFGPAGTSMAMGTSGEVSSGVNARADAIKRAGELEQRIEAISDEGLMDRLQRVDLDAPDAARKLEALERDLSIAEEGPLAGGELEPGLSDRPTAGRSEPASTASGNFAHENLEVLRKELYTNSVPKEFQPQLQSGEIITADKLPDGLTHEAELGVTARVDRVGTKIYEIKPNTASSIRAGLERIKEYVRLANATKFGGRSDWTGVIVIYDAKAARGYIP